MSVTYPLYTFSSYPDEIDQFDRFTDLTLDTVKYAEQYNTYMTKGDLTRAAQVLINCPELETSLINAANLNRIIDAIKCIETFYAEDVQKYLIEIVKYRGVYSQNTKYSKYDLTIHNDIGYLCISSDCPIGTSVTNTDFFCPLTWKGDQGASGLGLSFEGVWKANMTYSKDSAVSYGTCLYASTCDDNLAHTPSKTSSYWNLVTDFIDVTGYDNSSSGLSSETLQDAIDELNIDIINNTNKLNTIENGAQVNTVTGVKGAVESKYRVGNINISKSDIGLGKVDNSADADKYVKYATSAGNANTANSAATASTCTGNSATATNANYASSAGNSDSVDGFHFQISTTELNPGSSSLTTNLFYFVYE